MTYTKPFENCYSHYPMKKGKYQAQKTWNKLNDAGQLPDSDTIIKAIEDQKKERKFLKSQNRFVPPWKHFSTWLNAACFSDECEMPVRAERAIQSDPGNGFEAMVHALDILKTDGEEQFRNYCRKTKMPPGDVEAVEFKFHGKYNVANLTGGMLQGV